MFGWISAVFLIIILIIATYASIVGFNILSSPTMGSNGIIKIILGIFILSMYGSIIFGLVWGYKLNNTLSKIIEK
jgi:hypothetical protein